MCVVAWVPKARAGRCPAPVYNPVATTAWRQSVRPVRRLDKGVAAPNFTTYGFRVPVPYSESSSRRTVNPAGFPSTRRNVNIMSGRITS